MTGVRSVALAFWIATGSVAESDEQAGLSHLLEHMLFRGTPRLTSTEIDALFDEMGAELNAGTAKDSTSVYTRVLDRHLPRALEVIGDMVWRPALNDLDAERQVVLEEIAMYEDDPQDRVFDLLGEAVFPAHPLGRPIIGRADVVAAAQRDDLAEFHAQRYVPSSVVLAAAGSVDHDELVELVRRAGAERDDLAAPSLPAAPEPTPPRLRYAAKDTEQVHLCLGGPALARDDERRFALRVLDNILGGTSSSRLFQEVRERRGLAYSIFSFQSLYAETGQVGIYLGTRPDRLARALAVVADELGRLLEDGPTAAELDRGRENVKGRTALALESTSARMNRLGSSLLADMPVLSLDEVIERVDAVGRQDVVALMRSLFDPRRLSAAAIGPSEETVREGLSAVTGELEPAPAGVG
jgi:predicted Zn-dependent peptidase